MFQTKATNPHTHDKSAFHPSKRQEQHDDIIKKHIKPLRNHQKAWNANKKNISKHIEKESEPYKGSPQGRTRPRLPGARAPAQKCYHQPFLHGSPSFFNMFRYVFWWAFHVFCWLLHGFICFLIISSCCSSLFDGWKAPLSCVCVLFAFVWIGWAFFLCFQREKVDKSIGLQSGEGSIFYSNPRFDLL